MSNKNKTVKTEDSINAKSYKYLFSQKILRFAPLFFAFIAGASVVWFNTNHGQEPKKEEPVQEARNTSHLEHIVTQNNSTGLEKARAYNAQGLLYFAQTRYADAEASFERALEICPNYEIALSNLFNAKFVLKKFDESISLIQRLQKVRELGFQSDLRKCYLAYTAYLLLKKQPGQAQERIEQYFELKPKGNEFYDGANLYLKIAGFYFARDDFENCVRVSERILEIAPVEYKEERARLHSNLAISYYGLAEKKRDIRYLRFTEEHIRQARELDPHNEKIKDIAERCDLLFQSIEASKK